MAKARLRTGSLVVLTFAVLSASACRSGAPTVAELEQALSAAEADADRRRALEPQIAVVELDAYRGPPVVGGAQGPAQYVRALWRGFRPAKAMALVERLERHYRAPASPSFDEALDHVAEVLREAGFDGSVSSSAG
jgi:hypothetical protein